MEIRGASEAETKSCAGKTKPGTTRLFSFLPKSGRQPPREPFLAVSPLARCGACARGRWTGVDGAPQGRAAPRSPRPPRPNEWPRVQAPRQDGASARLPLSAARPASAAPGGGRRPARCPEDPARSPRGWASSSGPGPRGGGVGAGRSGLRIPPGAARPLGFREPCSRGLAGGV